MVAPANKRLVTYAELDNRLTGIATLPASTPTMAIGFAVVLRPATVTEPRPAGLSSTAVAIWDWAGDQAPVNMGPNDLWAA